MDSRECTCQDELGPARARSPVLGSLPQTIAWISPGRRAIQKLAAFSGFVPTNALVVIDGPDFWIVGNPSIILSPSAKLRLDADPVIDRGLNSLLAAKIAFGGLH
jgi:hypothetical protein